MPDDGLLPPVEIPIPEYEGHVIWGTPFEVDATIIEGADEAVGTITVYPEVVNIYDEDGQLLTMKLAHRLSSPVSDSRTGESTDCIMLGSFGQNDPVRMWFASMYANEILTEDFWEREAQATEILRGPGSKTSLDQALYSPFNASFIADPNSIYSEGNIHSHVVWPDALPEEVSGEIARRVQMAEPLNYHYLAHVVAGDFIPGIAEQPWTEVVLSRAAALKLASENHKSSVETGQEDDTYLEMIMGLGDLDWSVDYSDDVVFDDLTPEGVMVPTDRTTISDLPPVNIANAVIMQTHTYLMMFSPYFDRGRELPLIGDHIREELTMRMYDYFVENGHLDNMTLGAFASAVYELGLNQTDMNLRDYF